MWVGSHASFGDMCSQTDDSCFARARYRIRQVVLDAARAGTLSPDWRDLLSADARHDSDAERLSILDFVSTPVAAWEPHCTEGTWREALVAWHSAELTNENVYEEALRSDLSRSASAVRYRLTQLDSPVRRAELQVTLRQHEWLLSHRIRYAVRRDFLGAWYRAGLAAGGDDIDWLGWYRIQLDQRPGTAGLHGMPPDDPRRAELGEPGELAERLQHLPQYWANRD